MAIIKSVRDLRAYKQARAEVGRIFEVTKTFPKEERFSLTDQICRSSRAVKSTMAEAWGQRRYPASFATKVTDAIGEANETQSWQDDALDCGSITPTQHRDLDAPWQSLGGMIIKMIQKTNDFCKNAR